MAEPITLAALAINIGCGLASNATQAGGLGAYRTISGMLRRATPPENHDILKATHNAYVDAIGVMARAARKIAYDDEKATAKALYELSQRSDFRNFRLDGEHLPLEEADAAVDRLFDGSGDSDTVFSDVVVADLAAWGVELQPQLTALFREGIDEHPPWHAVFATLFAEQVKTNERAFRMLTFERLTELRSGFARMEEMMADQHGTIDALSGKLHSLMSALSLDRQNVEQLERLFFKAAYNADILAKGLAENEAVHVAEFKKAAFEIHEIATIMLERHGMNDAIGRAVVDFYESFRRKEALTTCKEFLMNLKALVE